MPGRQDTSKLLDSILHLRTSPLLRKLTSTSLAPLAYHAREVRFAAGDVVAQQSEISNQFWHILDGTVRSSTGETRGVREALEGFALLAGIGMPLEAVADTDLRALVIPGDALFEALEDDSNLLQQLIHGLAARLLLELERLGGEQSIFAMPIAGLSAEHGNLDLVQKMLLIQRAQDLRRTAATALADAARNTIPFRAPKGEFLWRRGDNALHGYLILSGTVSALYPDRSPVRLGPGVALGALDVLAGVPRRNDLISNDEVFGLKSQLSRLFEALEDHFEMATAVLSTLARETLKVLCPSCRA
jgi:CRP-like cAMP-binding protein